MKEFKKFISKGNVMEMAVGLIMAVYFGAIVKSLVNDILMPPIGKLIGGVNFSKLKYVIQSEIKETIEGTSSGIAEVAINYGLFLNTIITFLVVAYAIFIFVRLYNKVIEKTAEKEEEIPAVPIAQSKEVLLLTEIRDLLQKKHDTP